MKKVNELFVQQMTRKEFLQFLGLAVLGVFGFKNLMAFIMEYQQQSRQGSKSIEASKASSGFGASKFGV